MSDKVFISGDAIPSDTIIDGEALEKNNCFRQDIHTEEKLRPSTEQVKEGIDKHI